MNEINELLNQIAYQTYDIFGDNVDQKSILEFREYLEDIILFDVISCKRPMIEVSSKEGNITDNIRLALIASGISKDGIIPEGKQYVAKLIPVTKDIHYYAKQRVREIDEERLNGTYINRMTDAVEYMKHNQNTLPNVSELIELGIAQNERNCGYVEDHSGAIAFYEGASLARWLSSKEKLIRQGYGNTIAFNICNLIYDRPQQKHYPLATKTALKKIAEIDMYMSQYGISSYDNDEEIEEALRNIEAAKITDPEIMERYENVFKTMIRNHKNSKKGLKLLEKKPLALNASKNN